MLTADILAVELLRNLEAESINSRFLESESTVDIVLLSSANFL
ncbi:MAG: hypothetical protein ACD_79C01227G0002 [uncultured bacterium]|nr:MAG: hypothetical protein ACD_79C01227G0002 [uncultured bacterium]